MYIPIPEPKTCRKCGITKTTADFNIRHGYTCKKCTLVASQRFYQKPENVDKRKICNEVRQYKRLNLEGTCINCGETKLYKYFGTKDICTNCVRASKRAYVQTPEGTMKGTVRSHRIINECQNRASKKLKDREMYVDNENWAIDNFRFFVDFSHLHTVSLSELTIEYHLKQAEEHQKWIDTLNKKSKKNNYFSEDSLVDDNEQVIDADLFAYP